MLHQQIGTRYDLSMGEVYCLTSYVRFFMDNFVTSEPEVEVKANLTLQS